MSAATATPSPPPSHAYAWQRHSLRSCVQCSNHQRKGGGEIRLHTCVLDLIKSDPTDNLTHTDENYADTILIHRATHGGRHFAGLCASVVRNTDTAKRSQTATVVTAAKSGHRQ